MENIVLPELELMAWEPCKQTLHLYLQIAGKIQLALMPRKNHWWNITLLVNAKGLITHVMPAGDFTFQILFNFQLHQVEVIVSNGKCEVFPLVNGLSAADFYNKLFAAMTALNIEVTIIAYPYNFPTDDTPVKTPFSQLTQYHTYDPEYVQRFWQILMWANEIFGGFGGKFYGKTSPVQLFWHHMDLVVTRFCGRRAPLLPADATTANKEAYSHELISFGFWAGDDKVREPAFYSYTYPSPAGLDKEPISPAAAKWVDSNGSPMALLMYNDIRLLPDARESVMSFLESCYRGGAGLLGWDISDLEVRPLDEL